MVRAGVLAVLVLIVLLAGCSRPILLDGNGSNASIQPRIISTGDGRPDIPRTSQPQDTPDDRIITEVKNTGEQPSSQRPVLIVPKIPAADLDVPLGHTIGQHHPVMTVAEFPLLKHDPIRVTGNLLVGYDERLRLDFGPNTTGRIEFTKDDTTDDIGTFLRFEEDKPIIEYTARLDRGTFYELQGREIQILGHKYVIAEATNTTVSLFGTNVPSNLFFEDGERLVVNSSARPDTRAIVRPNLIGFTLYAEGADDGDILLAPGESLTENVGRNQMASRVLDVRYQGAPMQNATKVTLRKTKFGYKLVSDTFAGEREIPLVEQDGGRLLLGRAKDRLRITPCAGTSYCIAPDDNFLLTSPDGKTFLLRYGSVDAQAKLLILHDTLGNRYDYKFAGTPGKDAYTDVILNKIAFQARIGPRDNATGRHNISIQGLKGDIVIPGGYVVRILEPGADTLAIDVIVPPHRTNRYAETTRLNITYRGGEWRIIVGGNLTFVEDERTDDTFAVTPYGMAILLDKNRRDALARNEGDEAHLLIPRSQAYGIVSLEG